MSLETLPLPTTEPAKVRGLRRLMQTASLLRSKAADHEEAEVYLDEEKRLARMLSRLQPTTEGERSDAALAA